MSVILCQCAGQIRSIICCSEQPDEVVHHVLPTLGSLQAQHTSQEGNVLSRSSFEYHAFLTCLLLGLLSILHEQESVFLQVCNSLRAQ